MNRRSYPQRFCAILPVLSDTLPGMATDDIEWLTIGQTAKLLGVSVSTVKNYERNGRISARRLASGHRRFVRAEVLPLVPSTDNGAA